MSSSACTVLYTSRPAFFSGRYGSSIVNLCMTPAKKKLVKCTKAHVVTVRDCNTLVGQMKYETEKATRCCITRVHQCCASKAMNFCKGQKVLVPSAML